MWVLGPSRRRQRSSGKAPPPCNMAARSRPFLINVVLNRFTFARRLVATP